MIASLALASLGLSQIAPARIRITGDEFDDLAPIAEFVQHAQVVQIGEATHGGAEFYTLKNRLVRYLHEKCGFKLLVLESGVLETGLAIAKRDSLAPKQLMDSTVFANFRWKESLPLFEYLKGKPELGVVGIDPQFSSDEVLPLVKSAVAAWDIELAEEIERRLGEGYGFMGLGAKPDEFRAKRDSYLKWLDSAIDRLQSRQDAKRRIDRRLAFLIGSFKDLRTYWNYEPDTPATNRFVLRDRIMASNAVGQIGSKKSIVWAHNGHLGKGLGYKVLGDYLKESYGAKTVSIGIFARRGEWYRHWQSDRQPWGAEPEGFEASFAPTDGAWFQTTKDMNKAVRAFEPENGGILQFVPRDRFDAVIVIDKISSPTKPGVDR